MCGCALFIHTTEKLFSVVVCDAAAANRLICFVPLLQLANCHPRGYYLA